MSTSQFRLFVAILLTCGLLIGGYVTYHVTHPVHHCTAKVNC